MRYEVGQKVIFIHLNFDNGYPAQRYLPWKHTLESIELIELECVEHHRVSALLGSPDDKTLYDGYLFTAADGQRWANQYPRYHNSQLSDSADYMIMEYRKGNVVTDKLKLMRDARVYLEEIALFLAPPSSTNPENAHMTTALRQHYDEIVAALAEQFHLRVISQPTVLEEDGVQTEYPEVPLITFTPIVD